MAKFYLDDKRNPVPPELEDQIGHIRVETGEGRLIVIERKEGRRNWAVKIDATHLRRPVSAMYDTRSEFFQTLAKTGQLVEGSFWKYRIETRRRNDCKDQTTHIESLSIDDKARDLVYLGDPADPDPYGGPIAGNTTPLATRSARPPSRQSPPPCGDCGRVACACFDEPEPVYSEPPVGAIAAGTARGSAGNPRPAPSSVAVAVDDHFLDDPLPPDLPKQAPVAQARTTLQAQPAEKTNASGTKRSPRVAEGKAWELFNSDGSVNVGSYAFMGEIGLVTLAHELLADRARENVSALGGTYHPPSPQKVKALAAKLLAASDKAQAATRRDGHVNRMDNSHTRARGAVRDALKAYPPPWGQPPEAREAWVENLSSHAAQLMTITMELHLDHYPPVNN